MVHSVVARCRPLVLACVMVASVVALSAGQSDEGAYVIGPKDVLSISVYGQADLSGRFTVESDGTIPYALIERVRAAGLTVRGFELELKKLLADGYLVDPRVSVSVDGFNSQTVEVLGEVRSPGQYPLAAGRTQVLSILAKAGAATTSEVILVRPRTPGVAARPGDPDAETTRLNLRMLQSGQLASNVELRHGDTIWVPKAEEAYASGEVKSAGSYAITPDMSVLIFLTLAGGPTETAALNRIEIVRTVDGKEVRLKNVKQSDRVLPGDVVIVPTRYL